MKINCSINNRNLKHGSHRFTRNLMLGLASSPSRVRFAAHKSAPLTAAGARRDHLVTSETVRVRIDVRLESEDENTQINDLGLTSDSHIEASAVGRGLEPHASKSA